MMGMFPQTSSQQQSADRVEIREGREEVKILVSWRRELNL
jgi:hypothetical protein